jgi:hypothetical protein
MREALGPALANMCLGRVGHVSTEAEMVGMEAYQRAVRVPPTEALRTMFGLLDEYGDATFGILPGWFSDPSIERSENLFRLWHAHANRAYRLYLADIIREDRMREQVALSRERMDKERVPMCFWLSADDALNMVRD